MLVEFVVVTPGDETDMNRQVMAHLRVGPAASQWSRGGMRRAWVGQLLQRKEDLGRLPARGVLELNREKEKKWEKSPQPGIGVPWPGCVFVADPFS